LVREFRGKKVLEVGNVLSNYYYVNHDILDKYEIANRVINQDIIDLKKPNYYDLIVSISTLEHVGWDEDPRVPEKIITALNNLQDLLAPGGKIVVTLPLGYNTYMDKLLKEGKISFTERYCLNRISKDNRWREVKWDDIREPKFNFPFPFANLLVIGIIEKDKRVPRYKNI
jgi:cyclopropane fatty-acyl-phospholipid synthase-like methyltransferase